MQNGLLPRFFESVTRQAFGDLAIDDAPALRYLTELLTRFVRTEALRTLRELPGRRLDTVADSLLAIQHVWDWQTPGFNPGTERVLRRQIGDYTLFMSGLFRTHIEKDVMRMVCISPTNPDCIALSGRQQSNIKHYAASSIAWLRQTDSQWIDGACEANVLIAWYRVSWSASRGQRRNRSSNSE